MRKTITIPAAGEILAVPMTGQSIIIEDMGVYPTAADVPTMELSPGISNYPLYPRSVYPNSDTFNQVIITGTSESAGDEITLISTEQCLQLSINIIFSGSYKARAGTTFEKASTDAAQSFTDLELSNANGELPKSIIITARTNPVAYAFNTSPDQTDFGHILMPPNVTSGSEREADFVEIEGIDFIQAFEFISANAGAAANLIVTPRY